MQLSSLKIVLNMSVLLVVGFFSMTANSDPAADSLNAFWLNTYGEPTPGSEVVVEPIQPNPLVDRPAYDWLLLAKADPDECYAGTGSVYPPMSPDGSCQAGSQPKVNPAYVFGMANTKKDIWFGTAANMLCMVLGGDFLTAAGIPPVPFETPAFTCEFHQGQYFLTETSWPPVTGGGTWPVNLAGFGDHRVPQIFRYNKKDETLTDVSPTTGAPAELLKNTYGLRAAGALDGVVLLAGPEVGNEAVLFYAYNEKTGALIAAQRFTEWGNVRSMEVANGQLYIAMQNVTANGSDPRGSVLKWTGSLNSPMQFVTVGTIPNAAAAFMAAHDDHLYVSTWYALGGLQFAQLPDPNGIWKINTSLSVPGGLPATPASLTEVFNFGEYENDPIVAASYFGAALHSYKGHLYFGTINFPGASMFAALLAHNAGSIDLDCNGNSTLDVEELLVTALGTFRPVSLFRGDNLGTPGQSVELLYGSPVWPSYEEGPAVGCSAGKGRYAILPFTDHLNNLGQVPSLGLPGINNFFNGYIWSMEEFDNKLFVGSFDWSSILAAQFIDLFPQALNLLPQNESIAQDIVFPTWWPGADLFRLDGTNPAIGETVSGFNNVSNYGVRTMVADSSLYVGTANPMNLNVGTENNDGGWELISLTPRSPQVVPVFSTPLLITLLLSIMAVVGFALRRNRRLI